MQIKTSISESESKLIKNKNLSLMKDEHETNKIQVYYKIFDNKSDSNLISQFIEGIICCRNN